MRKAILLIATALLAVPGFVRAQENAYSKLAAPADIEKITGAKGVMVMPMGAPNEKMLEMLMYMAGGKQVMIISFGKPNTFVMDKANAVAGVPDEAFESKDHSILCFRKGNRPVIVQSAVEKGKPMWSQDQLKALAKLIYSRM